MAIASMVQRSACALMQSLRYAKVTLLPGQGWSGV